MSQVTSWEVHNAQPGDQIPAPAVPHSWPVDCPWGHSEHHHVRATGMIIMSGQWFPVCQHGISNAKAYRAPYAVPAQIEE